ncbi:MAG: hypothetical protein F6K63_34160 [Moorea sp. SIO1G6]|nr:hypothetical protein [Moorena sp. SIO1G6]
MLCTFNQYREKQLKPGQIPDLDVLRDHLVAVLTEWINNWAAFSNCTLTIEKISDPIFCTTEYESYYPPGEEDLPGWKGFTEIYWVFNPPRTPIKYRTRIDATLLLYPETSILEVNRIYSNDYFVESGEKVIYFPD